MPLKNQIEFKHYISYSEKNYNLNIKAMLLKNGKKKSIVEQEKKSLIHSSYLYFKQPLIYS